MPELLLELFSEEIPARMQAKAADDLRRMVTDRLVAEGLVYEGAKAFATPRRLALTVHGIPARQSDLKDERRGPRVGGPEAAIQGFLKATGLASLEEAKIQRDIEIALLRIALDLCLFQRGKTGGFEKALNCSFRATDPRSPALILQV